MNVERPELTNALAMPPRLIVIGDVHGDLDKLKKALRIYGIIDNYDEWVCNPPNSIIVQMGDQVDSKMRNMFEEGAETDWEYGVDTDVILFMETLDMKARQLGGRVISLLGNHEIMNRMGDFSFVSARSMSNSGGGKERERRFQPGGDMAAILRLRPSIVVIGDIVFVHAGILPHHIEAIFNAYGTRNLNQQQLISVINTTSSNIIAGIPVHGEIAKHIFMEMEGLIWTRAYVSFDETRIGALLDEVLPHLGARRVIVGHTVVDNVIPRCNGKVWFVDCGLSRAFGEKPSVQLLDIRN